MQWYAAESRVAPFLAPLACYIQPPESIDAPRMPSPPAKPAERLRACGMEIARVGAELAARGWTPATSSNFSMRLDDSTVAVTISGRDKGNLAAGDVMAIALDGTPLDPTLRPSAETALHLQIYRRLPETGAVLHTHSHNQTVASRLFAGHGVINLHGWELQKAITGYTSHDSELDVPVFPNSQDMADIEARVDAWLDSGKPLHAYLIEGHGLYTWGHGMPEARRHLEALEFLLACELDLKRLGGIA
jgi:methylthioribulose-1-phosphate dehydratase